MKIFAFAFALLAGLMAIPVCRAAPIVPPAAPVALQRVDWQEPQSLPRRFRNHCVYDRHSGRPYCSDHCGFEYQFYYCSHESFGCCRRGFGYCDWNGILRCHP
jgi:hypothetical protein